MPKKEKRKEQHCSEPRGIKPKKFLPFVMIPEPHDLRDQGEPEPKNPSKLLQENQSEPGRQRESVPKERSETIEPHTPRV
eukprot:15347455-Ditylum_brightwellii.AAC.1